ncbi:hypothetical protein Y032_0005g2381 [Ancylostoma ceylanicum]|nr:hypothetical protein Y032_0005g2381 [Ancylostoma ceylanicum]
MTNGSQGTVFVQGVSAERFNPGVSGLEAASPGSVCPGTLATGLPFSSGCPGVPGDPRVPCDPGFSGLLHVMLFHFLSSTYISFGPGS